MDGESFPALEQNPDRSFSPECIDNLLMSEHLLNNHNVEDLDCPMIFPHPPCLPPPGIPMHAHQSGSLSPRALAQSTMSGQSPEHQRCDYDQLLFCVEIYPEYEPYPDSMKEYHPTYQELDLSHAHSFSQSRDILTSALVLNDIPEMGLDYHDLMAHKSIENDRWVGWLAELQYSSLLLLRSDYEERELRSQYFQSYDEMTDLSYNYSNYIYLQQQQQQQQQQQDMNNNHSKSTFSDRPR